MLIGQRCEDGQPVLRLSSGLLFASAVGVEHAIDSMEMDTMVHMALGLAEDQGYTGARNTPFVQDKLKELLGERGLACNKAITEANVRRGAVVAVKLASLQQEGS